MKTPLALCLALLAVAPASAQVFRPETVNGALLGGIAGAVIGHNSGSLNHNGWQGAAIGAGVGAIIGSAVGRDNDYRNDTRVARPGYGGSPYIYRDSPTVVVHGGYGGYPRRGGYYGGGYYGSVGYYGDGYYGGSAAANGLFLGALAGGIIGHNSGSLHHNGWRGAAWGAGAGWLLGSIADANRRAVIWERPVYVEQPAPVVVQQAPVQQAQPAAQPQQVTIINNYYGNAAPMGQANSLFGR
ncbi:MAG: YMGG-like glycine zipper-containing protein [Verrucomicrobia bacterium]|nr:YMGG-like glycine zipper-containing protein [Verrucomicrobiota bacterium]